MPEPHADDDRPTPDRPAGLPADAVDGGAGAPADPRPVADPSGATASAAAPATDGPPAPAVPSEEELERVATPATVRRAPRYGAFLVTGALVGAVLGLVLAAVLAPDGAAAGGDGGVLPFLGGENAVRAFCAVAGAFLGVLVGGLLAVLADRRSTRRQR
ncbi:histidine kinase [Cellulomonas shaoxiangyii]|uniref:histidine kinase n=1 Tax=Cellulomonas shaoxiangyii TaxID=2566013 RepID=UPI001AA0A41B|nr:histidine kinase [Cellulomonas shaoxiangyii]